MATNSMMKLMVGVSAMFGLMALSSGAFATTVRTPSGLADDSCVHQVPNGASVDVQTGDVSVRGATVDHVANCSSHLPCADPGGGWYEYSWSNATTIQGRTQFNYFWENWTVPSNPSAVGDNALVYLFSSMEDCSQLGTCPGSLHNVTAIIQPVLSWNYNDDKRWDIAAWAVWNCDSCGLNCQHFRAGPFAVNQGDSILGYMDQTASNNDSWEIVIKDTTTGTWAFTTITNIPNSWPKFNTVQGGVLEGYNILCSDLSLTGWALFNNPLLYEAGPNWNSYNNVTASASWLTYNNPKNLTPNCEWAPYVTNTYSWLTWSPYR